MAENLVEELVEAISGDWESAEVSDQEMAVLQYSVKLTQKPGAMVAEDVEELKAAGLDDLAIHDLASIVGYFAFVNRVADGLGVELEPS
mgnify:CR=1 FL=1